MKAGVWLAAGGAAMLAACVSQPAPAPEVRPTPPAPVERPAPPPPPPRAVEWQDLPLTRGDWGYRSDPAGSQAAFGPAGSAPLFVVRCDLAARQVTLSRDGAPQAVTVRTSYTARSFAAGAGAALPATDTFLDGLAFGRGRFSVEAPGLPMLVIPSWPEPARVIEDCRS